MAAPNALSLHPETDRALATNLEMLTWRIELAESSRDVAVNEWPKLEKAKDSLNGDKWVVMF